MQWVTEEIAKQRETSVIDLCVAQDHGETLVSHLISIMFRT